MESEVNLVGAQVMKVLESGAGAAIAILFSR